MGLPNRLTSTRPTSAPSLSTSVAAALAPFAGLLLAVAIVPAASAQDYPNRPVRLVVPFAAGGSSDILARSMAQSLAQQLGQPVVVENKPGAGGIIASEQVARAPADGYTLLFGTIGTHAINLALKKTLPFDLNKDFTAIGRLQDGPLVLVINPSVPAKNMRELEAYAKANPNKLAYASAGIGSISHLAGELFKSESRLDITHVPYKGGGAAMPDLLGGQVQMMVETIPNTLGAVKGGKLIALSTTGEKRSTSLPDVPTFAEQGLPKLTVNAWTGLFAPANLPPAIVTRLNSELAKIAKQPDYMDRIEKAGNVAAAPGTPAQFAEFVRAEGVRWQKVAADAGVEKE
ncbi:Bug family tripartite tricarboxylate transporter substrate binding protein [Pigmentiphaga litoralis]|uniref:Bug family tripartite tricarboxylate transporter substrate binding protein n=1 Tax=Pigmentiphaga litoralis TaxID=516702 RepID=UPI003B4321FD